jgi:type VI protein secretion system component VasK
MELNAFQQLVYLALVFLSVALLFFGTVVNIATVRNSIQANSVNIIIGIGTIIAFVLLGVIIWKMIALQKTSTKFLEKNLSDSLINVFSEKAARMDVVKKTFKQIKNGYPLEHLCPSDQALIKMIQGYLDSIDNLIKNQQNAIEKPRNR